jgi:anaerobic magnesium-protoporphyrin IX monomethyl ester cyclase
MAEKPSMAEPKIALIGSVKDPWAPPLQMAYIATYLRDCGGFRQVRVFDINHKPGLKELVKFSPDVVGISTFTPDYNQAIQMAQTIRKTNPDATIILGGHHISMLPSTLDEVFDLAVCGEGEETMLQLMEAYRKHGKLLPDVLSGINGVAYRQGGQVKCTQPRELIADLDKIPIPDRSFLPEHYVRTKRPLSYLNWRPVAEANIFTSRGCPYTCVFCSAVAFWGKTRMHSAGRVVEEIKYVCNSYHTDVIYIQDDLFAVNKKRVREVIEGLREANLLGKVSFGCLIRMNLINDEMCELLREMGVVLVGMGFESGNAEMLKYLKGESVSLEMGRQAVRTCKKYGFVVQGSIIIGNPGETMAQMYDTRKFIDELFQLGIDDIWLLIATALPGTGFWQYALEKGLVSNDMNWDNLKFTQTGNSRPVLYDENIDRKTFEDFYFALQAGINKHRSNMPISERLKLIPLYAAKACKHPQKALQILKHSCMAKT